MLTTADKAEIAGITANELQPTITACAKNAMIGTVQATAVAASNYAVGDTFILNDKLYKVDAAITTGEQIVPGEEGNCHETTVQAEILANFSVKTGAVAPTSSTVADFVGQFYNYTGGNSYEIYICTEIANGIYTWRRVFISNDLYNGINLSNYKTNGEAISIFLGIEARPYSGSYVTYANAIGCYAKATSSSLAIGNFATAAAGGTYNFETIQLGSGTNNTAKTFQVWTYRLLEADGTIPPERITPVENVTGSTPSITALDNHRYICGEVSTLGITLPASGCIDVVFESGSTPTVLTITPPTGVTVKWANGFDPTALDADTTYEINIMNGLGVACAWT